MSRGTVLDPVTSLPLVLKVGKCPKKQTETAFENALFRHRDLGASVVLFLKMVKRYGHEKKGKAYNRMMIISRTYLIVAYAGEKLASLRHADAIATRCVPIGQITELIMLPNETPRKIALRIAPEQQRPQYDMLLSFNDPEDIEKVCAILTTCVRHLNPPADMRVSSFPRLWTEIHPALNLKKPDGWVPPRTEDKMIPIATYNEIARADMERRKPRVSLFASISTIKNPAPDAKPADSKREITTTEPVHGLPPLPTPPEGVEDHDVPKILSNRLDEARDPMTLRKQIEDLKEQATLLTSQQKLHIATLDASQRVVDMIMLEKDDDVPHHGVAEVPSVPRSPSEINLPFQHSSPDLMSDVSDDVFSFVTTRAPQPPSYPPPPLDDVPPDDGHGRDSQNVEELEEQLRQVREEMTTEMQDKDKQIETLRTALQGMMEEEEEDQEDEDEDEDESWLEEELSPDPVVAGYADDSGLADLHAASIQTRRREVEELMRQLEVLESDDRSHDNARSTQELRTQLRAVLSDLEIEALSYQDGLMTGMPVTQRVDPLSPPSPLASRASLTPPQASQQQDQQQDTYQQWANYLNYLAAYYPSAYASYYSHFNQQMAGVAANAPVSPRQDVDQNTQWKQWKKVMAST